MHKQIILLLLFVGVIFITIGMTKAMNKPVEKYDKIIYKYIPRTFEEEQLNPIPVSDVFETMFSQPDPWTTSMRNYDVRKQENINRYFISQL